jgi:hypothetical protein
MSELRTARERLYRTMERAIGLVAGQQVSPQECNRLLGTDAWSRFSALERQTWDERDPAKLTALLDQMDAALAEIA